MDSRLLGNDPSEIKFHGASIWGLGNDPSKARLYGAGPA